MRRGVVRWLIVGVLAVAGTAAAERHRAAAHAYAKRHGLPARTIDLSVAGRRVQRVFVPVLIQTIHDFAGEFNVDKGAVVIRQSAGDPVHVSLLFRMGEGFGHGYINGSGHVPFRYPMTLQTDGPAGGYIDYPGAYDYGNDHPTWNPALKGSYLVLSLDPPQIEHLRGFLERGQAGEKGAHCVHGGCVWWLVHAPVGPEQPLAWAMGVKQSRGPEVLVRKLIHAGNERVGVVGIGMGTVEDFTRLSDADLLGGAPQMGVAEAVK
jgi:hypothetical protein